MKVFFCRKMETINIISDGADEVHQTEDIVFAVLHDGEGLLNVSQVENELSDHGELAGDLISESTKPEINSTVETVATKTQFFRQFLERVFESLDKPDSGVNDTAVTCGQPGSQEVVRVPALLLASVSPVFKAAGILTEAETQDLILPDANAHDFRNEFLFCVMPKRRLGQLSVISCLLSLTTLSVLRR